MAAGVLPAPGTEYGPCPAECQHTDCAETRRMAMALCTHCGEAIGYDRRFYNSREAGYYDHALCVEEAYEDSLDDRPDE